MKEFMMIFRNPQNPQTENGGTPTAEQMQAVMQQWQSWIQGIVKSGKYSGTGRLLPEGKTLKPKNVVIDGPYAEAKELIGGYLIVKAASLDEAVQMAKSCPGLLTGGNVEVRSVMPMESDANSKNFLEAKLNPAHV